MARIIVALDGSEFAESSLGWTAPLARALGDSLHLLTVHPLDEELWEYAGIDPSAPAARARESLMGYLDELAGRELVSGLTVTREVAVGDVVTVINDVSRQQNTRMVTLTTRGRGAMPEERGQGSSAMGLVRSLSVPILVVPPHGIAPKFEGLLVTVDGSEESTRALPLARELVSKLDLPLHLLRVVNVDAGWSLLDAELEALAAAQVRQATGQLEATAAEGETTALEEGPVVDGILDYARQHGCQLVVMATHGRSGRARLDLGSTADAMIRTSDRPVLLVPLRNSS